MCAWISERKELACLWVGEEEVEPGRETGVGREGRGSVLVTIHASSSEDGPSSGSD